MALSMPMPMKAESRCSVVEMSTALLHQAGMRSLPWRCSGEGFDFEAVEVSPPEDDTCTWERAGFADRRALRCAADTATLRPDGGLFVRKSNR